MTPKQPTNKPTKPAKLESPAPRIVAIIGTDTEIGKTVIAAALARELTREGLRVGVFKPFASDPATRPSGEGFSTDADLLARAAGLPGGEPAARGQLFTAPLAPLAAARLEGRRVNITLAIRQARAIAAEHDITLVEGCGGWLAPLTASKTTADFFAELGAPVLIVARAGLGTVNHTLLTIDAARGRGLTVLGVILNRCTPGPPSIAEPDNPRMIRDFGGVPVYGPIEHRPAANRPSGAEIRIQDLPAIKNVPEIVGLGKRSAR